MGSRERGPWAGPRQLWQCLFRKLQSQPFHVSGHKGRDARHPRAMACPGRALAGRVTPVPSPPGASAGPSRTCSCRVLGAQGWQGQGRRPRLLGAESSSLRLTQPPTLRRAAVAPTPSLRAQTRDPKPTRPRPAIFLEPPGWVCHPCPLQLGPPWVPEVDGAGEG